MKRRESRLHVTMYGEMLDPARSSIAPDRPPYPMVIMLNGIRFLTLRRALTFVREQRKAGRRIRYALWRGRRVVGGSRGRLWI